jgi:hypothetical protein
MTGTALQDDLFGQARWLERTTSSGARVRIQVEPAEPGRVRIVRFERRRPGERTFRRRPREEGRTVALADLAPGQRWDALFGRPP